MVETLLSALERAVEIGRAEAAGQVPVIGISGGLDSTQALLVCAQAFDLLGMPRQDILASTMPGFATSDHTKSNAWKLMRALGVTANELDIKPAARQMLQDLGRAALPLDVWAAEQGYTKLHPNLVGI